MQKWGILGNCAKIAREGIVIARSSRDHIMNRVGSNIEFHRWIKIMWLRLTVIVVAMKSWSPEELWLWSRSLSVAIIT